MRRDRTVVVHAGGIGDLLLALPAVERLAREGAVEMAGRTDRLELLRAAGLVEAIHDLDRIGFDSLFARPSTRLRTFLETFDRAVVWMRDDDGHIREGIRACGVRRAEAYPGLPPANWTRHASEYYLDCLGLETAEAEPFRLRLEPCPGEWDAILHPGSGSIAKNWPLDRFRAVAEGLHGLRVGWCAGPAEEERGGTPGIDFMPRRSLVELARTLSAARLYVGNDSGITHLAAAVGCPTVAVFGPTDPAVWAPRGPHVRVVTGAPGADGCPWPETAQVLAAAREMLASGPFG